MSTQDAWTKVRFRVVRKPEDAREVALDVRDGSGDQQRPDSTLAAQATTQMNSSRSRLVDPVQE